MLLTLFGCECAAHTCITRFSVCYLWNLFRGENATRVEYHQWHTIFTDSVDVKHQHSCSRTNMQTPPRGIYGSNDVSPGAGDPCCWTRLMISPFVPFTWSDYTPNLLGRSRTCAHRTPCKHTRITPGRQKQIANKQSHPSSEEERCFQTNSRLIFNGFLGNSLEDPHTLVGIMSRSFATKSTIWGVKIEVATFVVYKCIEVRYVDAPIHCSVFPSFQFAVYKKKYSFHQQWMGSQKKCV